MGNNPLLNFRIGAGFFVFGIFAAYGFRLLYRGIQDDVNDASGTPIAGRGWFIAGGIGCMLPLVAYLVFIVKQGFFGS